MENSTFSDTEGGKPGSSNLNAVLVFSSMIIIKCSCLMQVWH